MYADPTYKRFRDYLDVNEHEMARAKEAAARRGMQYGVYKRWALMKMAEEDLRRPDEEISVGAFGV